MGLLGELQARFATESTRAQGRRMPQDLRFDGWRPRVDYERAAATGVWLCLCLLGRWWAMNCSRCDSTFRTMLFTDANVPLCEAYRDSKCECGAIFLNPPEKP